MNTEKVKATIVPHGLTVYTARLIEKLKKGKVGDVIPDEESTDICGRDTSSPPGYGNLASAIRNVLNNYGIVWQRVRGAGCIKCINSQEIAETVGRNLKSISRRSKKTIKLASFANPEKVELADRSSLLANIAQLGTIELVSRKETTKKLAIRGVKQEITLNKLLESFQEIEKK